LQKDYMAL